MLTPMLKLKAQLATVRASSRVVRNPGGIVNARHTNKVVAAAAVALAVVAAACGSSASSSAPPTSAPTTYPVATTTLVFTDHSRSTPSTATQAELSSRTLPTTIIYPTQASGQHASFPLVVFSHGFTGTAAQLVPTMRSLASHGYVVAAPDFPLSTGTTELDLGDFASQPGDVSFVITKMLAESKTKGSMLYQQIDPKKIGVAGHSLGAVTTLAVAYNSCCHDARIGAVAELDGELTVPGNSFSGTYFKGHNPPLLIVNGTADQIAPFPVALSIFAQAASPKYLMALLGAPHTGFMEEPWSPVVDDALAAFFNRYLGAGGSVAQIKAAGSKHGVATMNVAHAS
jgi:predicted dienelactone hydrolase